METYIVRIYRRKARKASEMVGVVELVGCGEKRAFSCLDELWGIIDPAGTMRCTTVEHAPGKKADKRR